MRHLSLVFLVAALVTACGDPSGPSFHDPWYIIYAKVSFDSTAYPGARFELRLHAIADPDNQGQVPIDEHFAIQRGECSQMAFGTNNPDVTGNDSRIRYVLTAVPVVNRGSPEVQVQPGDTLGPVFQSDTLDPSPNPIPFPAPWGREPEYLVAWTMEFTNSSQPRPTLLPFDIHTMKAHGDNGAVNGCTVLF